MTDRKTELLTVAEELLQTRGYSGFSYADLASALGISKAAIHHHFPKKEDLGLALYEGYLSQVKEVHHTIDEQAGDTLEAFAMLVEAGRQLLVDGCKTCPSGILEAELAALPPSLADSARRLDQTMHEWMTGLLTRGRARGEVRFEGAPEDQAWLVLATFQGAFQKARSAGPETYQIISRQLIRSMAPGDTRAD